MGEGAGAGGGKFCWFVQLPCTTGRIFGWWHGRRFRGHLGGILRGIWGALWGISGGVDLGESSWGDLWASWGFLGGSGILGDLGGILEVFFKGGISVGELQFR